jgi:hypothetical protein
MFMITPYINKCLSSFLYGPGILQITQRLQPLLITYIVEQNRQDCGQETEGGQEKHHEAEPMLERWSRRLILNIAEQAQTCTDNEP